MLATASALAKCYSFYVIVFYVMAKALSGELFCPCDRSCLFSDLAALTAKSENKKGFSTSEKAQIRKKAAQNSDHFFFFSFAS